MALTDEDKRLAKAVFHQGPSALVDEGWSWERIQAFQQNPDVLDIWMLLKREFDIHEGLRARAKFTAARNINKMIDPASAVIAQALAGPDHVRDARGIIQRDALGRPMLRNAEPTAAQIRAAEFILEGAGIRDHRIIGDSASDPSLKLLFASSEEEKLAVEDDPLATNDEQRSLSRERVRNAITRLTPRVVEARAVVKKATGIDPATETSTAKLRKQRGKRAKVKEPTVRGRKTG